MIALWYGLLAGMLAIYIALDGRNFGAGVLHWIVAKERLERRQIIAAIGPLWSWHEVWLVGAGGVMIMAFPSFMASAFSGYYLALFLVLWCILLRGISIEVGGHFDDPLWQGFWDFVFFVSNVLLAVLFGAAFGNLVRGEVTAVDTRGSLVWSDGPPIAVLGLEDLVVVAANGRVLVIPRARAQDVKQLVERLGGPPREGPQP